jgi:hypothetical protein
VPPGEMGGIAAHVEHVLTRHEDATGLAGYRAEVGDPRVLNVGVLALGHARVSQRELRRREQQLEGRRRPIGSGHHHVGSGTVAYVEPPVATPGAAEGEPVIGGRVPADQELGAIRA